MRVNIGKRNYDKKRYILVFVYTKKYLAIGIKKCTMCYIYIHKNTLYIYKGNKQISYILNETKIRTRNVNKIRPDPYVFTVMQGEPTISNGNVHVTHT